MDRLLLRPEVTYTDLVETLRGWTGGAADRAPRLGGEPTLARWTKDGARITYSANPAIGLRVLEGEGLASLAGRLPTLGVEDAIGLVRARDATAEDALLGVTALGLLGDAAALPYLDRLGTRGDPDLAGATDLARRRIGTAALAAGAARIAERGARAPGVDPVLGLLRPVAVRRQVLRRVLAEPPAARGRLVEVVRAGLADDDWEVAWSAVLGAHAHHLPEVLLDLRRCPPAPERGLRSVLDAVREVVGHRLAGTRADLAPHPATETALHCLLVTSLRQPLPDETDEPPTRGFARVAALPHWLGQEGDVRRVQPPTPYDVAVHATPGVTVERVADVLRARGHEHGRELRLPTPDELEMAVRGPDGRRFPWGNAREPGWRRARSPWGLEQPLRAAEWVEVGPGRLAALPPVVPSGCGARPVEAGLAALRPVATP